MPETAPPPAAPAVPAKPQPSKPPIQPGSVPMSERPAPKPRSEAKDMGEFFGVPKPEPPKPKPDRPPKSDAKPAEASPKPAEAPAKEEPATPDDLDALVQSARPPKPKPVEHPDGEPAPPEKGSLKQFRETYEQLKLEHEQLKKRVANGETESKRIKDYTDAIEKLQKERDDLAQRLEFADFKESPTWNDRYTKPMQAAMEQAVEQVKGLKHQLEDRTGTQDDVYDLYRLLIHNPAGAAERAEELFGRAGALLLFPKLESVKSIESASRTAYDDWQKTSQGRRALVEAEGQKQRQHIVDTFNSQWELEELSKADLLNISEDPGLGDLYKKAKTLVNVAFVPDGKMTPEQLVRHSAKVASMAASLPVVLSRYAKLEKENTELREALEEFDGGKPRIRTTGDGDRTKTKKQGVDAIDDYIPS